MASSGDMNLSLSSPFSEVRKRKKKLMRERVKENDLEKTEAYIRQGRLTKSKPNNEVANRETDALAPIIISFSAFVVFYSNHEHSKYLQ